MKRFLVSIILILSCSLLSAAIWFVPDSLNTIQSAINKATSGDTVLVTGAFSNVGPVKIVDKQISLFSKNYLNNPSSYSIASGTALFDTLNTEPLLTISNADNSMIMGFLLDKSDIGNGGGVIIENSNNVILDALHFNKNTLSISNSNVFETNTEHYSLDSANTSLIYIDKSLVYLENSTWKNNSAGSLLSIDNNSEFYAQNLASYNNTCTSNLYDINASYAYFNFTTTYLNTTPLNDWNFTNDSYTKINSSILQNNPPLDIAQCEIIYSALPGPYPGHGNLFKDPLVDTLASKPILLSISPCISAANPDTNGIARIDLIGNARPNPEWAPPDMGAFESERYIMFNNSSQLWISPNGHDIWGNGTLEYPFASLQTAVDHANNLDTIIFKPGTYSGQTILNNNSLTISSEYIFNADSTFRDSVILVSDTSAYAPLITAISIDSLKLYGLTFKNGRGRFIYNNYSLGGALYLNTIGKATLNQTKFTDNQADYSGGAIYALDSYLEISKTTFSNNVAYFGGAISLSASIANVSHINFNDNSASSGGALFANNISKYTSYYSTYTHNTANSSALPNGLNKPLAISQYGGAIYSTNSEIRLYNSLFNENYATNQGSAIALRGSKLALLQSTVSNNFSDNQNASILYLKNQNEQAIIANSILWNENENEIELINSDLKLYNSCLLNALDNILQDSLSSSIASNLFPQDPKLETDFSLKPTSPYLNSGLIALNYDSYYLFNYNENEFNGNAPGLGYTGAHPNISFILEEFVSSIDQTPIEFEILRAYPNPFNPTSTLEFTLRKDANTRLDLYDINGRHIKTIVQDYLYSGKYSYKLHAHKLPSGVYICRLTQNGINLSNQKILLVK